MDERIINIGDNNIASLRARYPQGLHFVVGDTHGECATLQALMQKICFDPAKDHVFFVGDYNAGGDVTQLLNYIGQYYQADSGKPGFHLIRGNHERELYPYYSLANLPDILVYRGRIMTYYLVHAGMVNRAFDIINADLDAHPQQSVFAYALADNTCCMDAPLRQITWSRRGLYSQRSHYHVWPDESALYQRLACIIHGHTPFTFMKKGNYFSYGDKMLFWAQQRIWFAEDLQSFNIDSNVKGRYDAADSYRGLSCVCLEAIDEIAETDSGILTREAIRGAENFVFSCPLQYMYSEPVPDAIDNVLHAAPAMKRICLDANNMPYIAE